MNKVLFNNGGQPVYLDDLETIQSLASDVLPGVLKQLVRSAIPAYSYWTSGDVLGNIVPLGSVSTSAKGFFITPFCAISRNDVTKKVVLDFFEGGYVCIGNELLEYTASKIELDYGAPFYVIVKKELLENRSLDNGEVAACKEHKYAVITKDPSESDCYSSAELCSLADAIYNIVSARRKIVEEKWTKLSVSFMNGYSGTVEYRETTDSYRYKINIASGDTTEKTGDIDLFDTKGVWPGGFRDTVSCLFGAGGDDQASASMIFFSQDGVAMLHPLAKANLWYPANCPVKVIFEIPK